MRRTLWLAFALAITLPALALPAWADSPSASGWWTSVNTVAGSFAPVAGADLPPGGLLVQSDGGSQPLAYAALKYPDAPPAGSAASLMLQVAPNSATTPASSLELCPLTSATFTPAAGGSMSDTPHYSCSKHVTAEISSDGKSFHVDLSALTNGNQLALAILPAGGVERVALAQPGETSLSVPAMSTSVPPISVATPAPSNPSPVSSDTGSPSGMTAAPASSAGSASVVSEGALPSTVPGSASAVSAPAIARVPDSAPTVGVNGPRATGRPGSTIRSITIGAAGGHSQSVAPLMPLVAVVAVVLAGLLWGYAGSLAARSTDGSPQQV